MASSQKLSLRAYSFCFRKWKGKNPEQMLLLNSEAVFKRLQGIYPGEQRCNKTSLKTV